MWWQYGVRRPLGGGIKAATAGRIKLHNSPHTHIRTTVMGVAEVLDSLDPGAADRGRRSPQLKFDLTLDILFTSLLFFYASTYSYVLLLLLCQLFFPYLSFPSRKDHVRVRTAWLAASVSFSTPMCYSEREFLFFLLA